MLAGCAQSPDSISPVALAPSAYASMSCSDAAHERNRVQNELTALEGQQRSAVTGDAIGVFLIGLPMSSLSSGDKAGLIGTRKGEILALDGRLRSCTGVRT